MKERLAILLVVAVLASIVIFGIGSFGTYRSGPWNSWRRGDQNVLRSPDYRGEFPLGSILGDCGVSATWRVSYFDIKDSTCFARRSASRFTRWPVRAECRLVA